MGSVYTNARLKFAASNILESPLLIDTIDTLAPKC